MPWIAGIDEAGYGPNLGPLVMASVCCRVPDGQSETNLWRLLKKVVRRRRARDDGRLLIEDSKIVYSPAKSLKQLERGVLATLCAPSILAEGNGSALCLAQWVEQVGAAALTHLREECWFHGTTALPVTADREELRHIAQRFHAACAGLSLMWISARVVIVCPPRFNAILERNRTKAAALMLGFAELLQHLAGSTPDTETVHVHVDKHGGRNRYEDIIRNALPAALVETLEEGGEHSAYRVTDRQRELHIHFEPRADGNHFPVALASMLAKYLRELLMLEFNQFWRQHLPDLEPTAGYPGDAARFMDAIRPIAATLGIDERALWRQR